MIALWDTTGNDVVKALAAERRNAGGVASGLALTLVAVVDEKRVKEAETAGATAAAAHPCRLLIVVRGSTPANSAHHESRLDAEIVVGGRLGPCEAVVMRTQGRLTHHAESVVIPLLAPDVPVVTWWHDVPPERIATDPLGVVAERRITDAAQAADPMAALRQRAEDYAPGDTDLAWTRSTPWRALIAGALDTAQAPVTSVTITADPADPTAALVRGWLSSRLGLNPTAVAGGPSIRGVVLRLANGDEVAMHSNNGVARLERTGLPGRHLTLHRRPLGEQLAEELRHLDRDQAYSAALAACTGLTDLESRSPSRVHIWHDPSTQSVTT